MTAVYHVITPGDHFSPRTGSALPTVVDGLARGGSQDDRFRQFVVVQDGTWMPRYESAVAIGYRGGPPPSRRERLVDAVAGRAGLPRPFAGRAYRPVAERLGECEPGIVVAHNGTALMRMPELSPHRRVLYAHNDLFRSYSDAEAARVVAACDRVICVSEYLRGTMAARVPAALRGRLGVVVNGVDVDLFTPEPLSHARGTLRVMFVGRVIPDKGVDVLVDAVARLDRDDMEVVVVGSQGFDRFAQLSDYERGLRARAGARVRFEPFVDRETLPQLLREQDVLVVPSRWPEPCGLTVGEGMASGLAVVASRSGGIPEVLGDVGILVPPGDVEALAAALADLADDPARRGRLGAAARARAEARDWRFAWGRAAAVLEQVR